MQAQKQQKTIALVGNPNVGKSTLFNALTGSHQVIGNWPGVTVEKKEGSYVFQGETYQIVDLPGIYQLETHSDDERVAVQYLQKTDVSLLVVVVDACHLARSLPLALSLLELKKPTILALNMMDLAKHAGLEIDFAMLAKELDCPVIGLSSIEAAASFRLKQAIAQALVQAPVSRFQLNYLPEIEQALPLQTDQHAQALLALQCLPLTHPLQHTLMQTYGHSAAALIAQTRQNYLHTLLNNTITARAVPKRTISDKIDDIVLHPVLCVPIFLGMMFVLFGVVQTVGSYFVDFFDAAAGIFFVEYPAHIFDICHCPGWLKTFFVYGVGNGIQTLCSFIPIIFLMFFCLGLLEQSGYLARAAFVMDRLLQTIGLPGQSFIPLILGFGCTTTAIMSTRVLNHKNDKLLTVFMASLMSCSARIPVYAALCAAFFGSKSGLIIFSLYLLGIAVSILTGLLFGKTVFKTSHSSFLLELPTYHWPQMSMVWRDCVHRIKDFLKKAGFILVVIMAVLGTLNSLTPRLQPTKDISQSILSYICRGITPIFSTFGIQKDNWPAGVALTAGLFAKESIITCLGSLYLQDKQPQDVQNFSWGRPWFHAFLQLKSGFVNLVSHNAQEIDTPLAIAIRKHFTQGPWQVYSYLVFILLYVPCIGAMSVAMQEIGLKASALLFVYLLIIPWSLATLCYQCTLGHHLGLILLALAILAGVTLSLSLLSRQCNAA